MAAFNVDSGRPLCATTPDVCCAQQSGLSLTAWRTGEVDPKETFRFEAMNGR
jgi:hypothetical protein